MKERLQKVLSQQGICSRRTAEKMIEEGRVQINGAPARIGDMADIAVDEIAVDGEVLSHQPPEKIYLMLNKPRGYVTTLEDEMGRDNVRTLIQDVPARVHPIGRLDRFSEGLLLMTNDGELTFNLTHPSHEVFKEYLVRVAIPPERASADPAEEMRRPMEVDGQALAPARCRKVADVPGGAILLIAIREGKNRQIRKMCEYCGYKTSALKRVGVGKLKLSDLPVGKWRYLTEEEIAYLRSL